MAIEYQCTKIIDKETLIYTVYDYNKYLLDFWEIDRKN